MDRDQPESESHGAVEPGLVASRGLWRDAPAPLGLLHRIGSVAFVASAVGLVWFPGLFIAGFVVLAATNGAAGLALALDHKGCATKLSEITRVRARWHVRVMGEGIAAVRVIRFIGGCLAALTSVALLLILSSV